MKLLFIILTTILCATASAQTIKTLGFNSTNGQVVANTGTNVLTFTNNVNFDAGDIQFVGTQIVGNGLYIDFDDGAVGGGPITLDTNSSIAFQGASAATTRTNLGLPLAALTNTSNVTMMRALAGSTFSNEPYSGAIQFLDWSTNDMEMTVSNGIILNVTDP